MLLGVGHVGIYNIQFLNFGHHFNELKIAILIKEFIAR